MSGLVVITVPADGLAQLDGWTSAGTMMTKFRSHLGPAIKGLIFWAIRNELKSHNIFTCTFSSKEMCIPYKTQFQNAYMHFLNSMC